MTRMVLAAAHLDHDPRHNRLRNLRALCQWCHMLHDRPHHLAQRRITYRRRWAIGDLSFDDFLSRVMHHLTQGRRVPTSLRTEWFEEKVSL